MRTTAGSDGRDPIWKALLAAAVLHGALLAFERFAPEVEPLSAELTDTTRGDTFDIETEPPKRATEEARAPQPAAYAPPPSQEASPRAGGEARAKVAPKLSAAEIPAPPSNSPPIQENIPRASGAEPEGPALPPSPSAAPSPSASDDQFSAPEGPPGVIGVPGLDGKPVWTMPGVLAPSPTAAPAPTLPTPALPVDSNIAGQVLSGSQHKRDHDLGIDLPAGGVVASALASAVRSSEAPADARATFEVRLGADGKVIGIRVVSSTKGDAGTWERVAKSAGANLAARALAMNGDAAARGATVTVKVESKLVYPAGTKEKYDVQPVCAEEVIEEAIKAIQEGTAGEPSRGPINDPAMNRPDPAAGLTNADDEERKRRFCIPIGVRGKGDLSNLGAHKQTVVRSTFKVLIPGVKALEDVKKVETGAPWSKPDPNKVQRIKKKWPKKKKKAP
jgi:hypothetical protein